MSITQRDLTWMFEDPDWKNKFLIGSLLALTSTLIPFVGLAALAVIYGYALIIMRAVMRGEPRTLPRWDDLGKLFVDGVQAALAALGYILPGLLILFAGFAFMFATLFGGAFTAAAAGDSRGGGPLVVLFLLGQLGFLMSLALGLLLYFVGLLIAPVAVGQYARTGDIAAGYRFAEIWRILRANTTGFVIAWLVYLALSVGLGLVLSLLTWTIVLCLFVPFLTAPVTLYLILMFAQLFGEAYREGARLAAVAPTTLLVTS